MTLEQLHTIETFKRLGYWTEYARAENNGIIRVLMPRKWREGIMSVLVRPDGTYRDSHYTRWDDQVRRLNSCRS